MSRLKMLFWQGPNKNALCKVRQLIKFISAIALYDGNITSWAQREVDKKRLDRMGGRKPDGSVKKEAQADSTLLRMKMSAKKGFSKKWHFRW